MPDKAVTPDGHLIVVAPFDQGVRLIEIPLIFLGVGGLGLHAVFGGDNVEVILDELEFLRGIVAGNIAGGADEEEIFVGFEDGGTFLVDAGRGSRRTGRTGGGCGGHCRHGGQECSGQTGRQNGDSTFSRGWHRLSFLKKTGAKK